MFQSISEETNPITNEILAGMAKDGDKEAGNVLYQKNIKLIHSIINKYKKVFYMLDGSEMLSIAGITFTKVIKQYDPNKGAKFSTYLSTAFVKAMIGEVQKFNKKSAIPLDMLTSIEALNKDDEDFNFLNVHGQCDTYSFIEENDMDAALKYGLSTINEKYHSALLSVLNENKTFQVAGEELGCTKQNIHRQFKNLQDAVAMFYENIRMGDYYAEN